MLTKYRKLFFIALIMLGCTQGYAEVSYSRKSNNPFEMVIFNIGLGKFESLKMNGNDFTPIYSPKSKNRVYELSVEVPWYKKYSALGFQFNILNSKQLMGNELSVSTKFRLPISFKLGHIALTNSYRIGAVAIFAMQNEFGGYDGLQFGLIASPSAGIDYFPIKWLGFYCEYSWRFANVMLNRLNDHNDGYRYSTHGLSLGLKLTF